MGTISSRRSPERSEYTLVGWLSGWGRSVKEDHRREVSTRWLVGWLSGWVNGDDQFKKITGGK